MGKGNLIIFLHRLNIDGATMVVKEAIENDRFRNSFNEITVVSISDGPMHNYFTKRNCNVIIFPIEDLCEDRALVLLLKFIFSLKIDSGSS